jgi:hypothetical protein
MLFWPVVIALGPGFAALYYDHDVKSFSEQSACEQELPGLEERAKQSKEFITALTRAAGDDTVQVEFRLACIDKTPQEFQRDLENQAGEKSDI